MTARRPDQPSTIAESGAAAGPRRAKLSPVDDDFAPRTVTDDEFVDFLLAVQTGFGNTVHDDLDEYPAHLLTPDRALAVRDGGTSGGAVVATAGSYAFEVTVPGGAQLPIAGVSMVTVHPTHRRRGILRRMMTAQLDDVARRGEPLAGLTASEASIYPRFGYGAATFTTRWELESHHAQLLETRPEQDAATGGRVRIVDATAGAAAAHAVYSRVARTRVGELARPEAWWPKLFTPTPRGPRFFTAVHDDAAGTTDAFARYVIDERWPDGVADSTLRVVEVQAVDADAAAAMWSYLFGIDLVGTITASERPVDDPIRWQLPDIRRLRVRELRDHLWVRVLDVARVLSSRTYGERRRARCSSWTTSSVPTTRGAGSSTADPTGRRAPAPTAPPISRSRPPTSARCRSVACRCRRSQLQAACASSRPVPSRAAIGRSSRTRRRGAPRTSDADPRTALRVAGHFTERLPVCWVEISSPPADDLGVAGVPHVRPHGRHEVSTCVL